MSTSPPQNSAGSAARPRGRPFQPGKSGNPGGRPKVRREMRRGLRDLAEPAVAALRRLLEDEGTPAAVRLRAAELVVTRVLGRVPDPPSPEGAAAGTVILVQRPPGTPLPEQIEAGDEADEAA